MAIGDPVTLHFHAARGSPVVFTQDDFEAVRAGKKKTDFYIACQQQVRYFRRDFHMTGDPRFVNCEACKKTAAYQEALAYWLSDGEPTQEAGQ